VKSTVLDFIKNIIIGFIIGIANIIPGVSGGTFALILGIYSKLMSAVGSLTPKFFIDGLALIKKGKLKESFSYFLNKHTKFLLMILFGASLSIISVSKLLKSMLENNYEMTYGFFLGLIVFSIIVPIKLLDNKKLKNYFWLILGLGLTLFISMYVDPSLKVLQKSANYAATLNGTGLVNISSYSISDFLSNFFIGALAISAMVLPGISGSFIMLLFGKYYQIISSIARIKHLYIEDIIFLGSFGIGIIVGGIVFVKLFNMVYSKFKNQTIFFLIGLMLGSFYALWPFKQFIIKDIYTKINGEIIMREGVKIYSNKLAFPSSFEEAIPVVGAFVVGSIVMLFFIKYEK